ncbi:hypothetical protein FKM82_002689 [Ascaphus truei]
MVHLRSCSASVLFHMLQVISAHGVFSWETPYESLFMAVSYSGLSLELAYRGLLCSVGMFHLSFGSQSVLIPCNACVLSLFVAVLLDCSHPL